jgi:predicted nucleic acid-binding protein
VSPKAKVFVDTGAIIALVDEKDEHHNKAKAYWSLLEQKLSMLYTTDYVLDETLTFLKRTCGLKAAKKAYELMFKPPGINLSKVGEEDIRIAVELFFARKDKRYSFTDCISFTVMRRLRIIYAFAFDWDFVAEGFITDLTNLPD